MRVSKGDGRKEIRRRIDVARRAEVFVLLLVAMMFGAHPLHAKQTAELARPNIIIVLTDDQGFGDVGVHGNTMIRTPHLDRFAAEGVRLSRFYCSPVCAPTRASLLTGRYYYRTGVIHTSRGGARMHTEEITIAERLLDAGYATAVFGKWHLGDNYPMRPADQGFPQSLVHKSGGIGQTPDRPNSYFDSLLWRNNHESRAEGYCTDVFFDAAIAFIEQHRESPFFIYLAPNAPHTPLEVADRWAEPYRQAGLNDTTARVYGMVENIDSNFGRLLGKLDQWELRENTLIVFAGDNGPQQSRYNGGLRGRKASVYEGGIRTACFWQWPRRLPTSGVVEQIAAHIDVAPTVYEAAGVEADDGRLDGESLLPWLADPSRPLEPRTRFFQCHRGLTPKKFQNCAVVTQDYKLVSHPKAFSNERFESPQAAPWELYAIAMDSGERDNLASRKPKIVEQLDQAYRNWFQDVRSTREFKTPAIYIGSAAEPITRLCRYQDGLFRDGVSTGWLVRVKTGGKRQLEIRRDSFPEHSELFVRWNDATTRTALRPVAGAPDRRRAEVYLPAGKGVLDVWVQAPGTRRTPFRDNSTNGDVWIMPAAR